MNFVFEGKGILLLENQRVKCKSLIHFKDKTQTKHVTSKWSSLDGGPGSLGDRGVSEENLERHSSQGSSWGDQGLDVDVDVALAWEVWVLRLLLPPPTPLAVTRV